MIKGSSFCLFIMNIISFHNYIVPVFMETRENRTNVGMNDLGPIFL